MGFSSVVKNEILRAERSVDACFCMIAGEILSAGSLVVKNHNITFAINSESEDFLKIVIYQLKKCFQIKDGECIIADLKSGKGRFELCVDARAGSLILKDLGILSVDKNGELQVNRKIDDGLIQDDECKTAFLAGAFVGAGTITVPEGSKTGYHMEWISSSSDKANFIMQLLAELNIISKKIERNGSFVVYLKESEAISNALVLCGAVGAMLKLENNKVERSVRNNINRQSNCLSANLDKTVLASVEELKAIETIKSTIGLDGLNEKLRAVADARINNPQASLAEIAKILGGDISRAAVSLRLKNIIKIANTLGENDGQ